MTYEILNKRPSGGRSFPAIGWAQIILNFDIITLPLSRTKLMLSNNDLRSLAMKPTDLWCEGKKTLCLDQPGYEANWNHPKVYGKSTH